MAAHAVTSKGQITIPKKIRDKFGLVPGALASIEEQDGKIVLTPQRLIDADQAWFWTPEWQEGQREAEKDIRAGRVSKVYDDVDEFIADLRSVPADA